MPETYSLQLSDGQSWCIVANESTKSWTEKFASIIGIKSSDSNKYPKLIFIRAGLYGSEGKKLTNFLDSDLKPNLPKSGWICNVVGIKSGRQSLRFWVHNDVKDVIIDIGIKKRSANELISMCYVLHFLYLNALQSGGLPIHSALIGKDGIGVLLPAVGGTGKTTCCLRVPPPWRPLADDENLIVCDKQGQYRVHPFPTWSRVFVPENEETWDIQKNVQLKSIFFLEQSQTDEAIPMGKGQSAMLIGKFSAPILSQTLRSMPNQESAKSKMQIIDNAINIARSIPAFKLKISLDGNFWEVIEKSIENV
jgi:SynChlorMet cassette protein ScmC